MCIRDSLAVELQQKRQVDALHRLGVSSVRPLRLEPCPLAPAALQPPRLARGSNRALRALGAAEWPQRCAPRTRNGRSTGARTPVAAVRAADRPGRGGGPAGGGGRGGGGESGRDHSADRRAARAAAAARPAAARAAREHGGRARRARHGAHPRGAAARRDGSARCAPLGARPPRGHVAGRRAHAPPRAAGVAGGPPHGPCIGRAG
eukprot:3388283-Prymnesium_polylepis.1